MGKKRAQVTVFLIVGIIMVVAFLFVLFLASSLSKSRLQTVKEGLELKAFQKEALRIYMDDCLTDELEMGLLLLGKQGRIWQGQPGGRKFFEEGKTGLTINPTEEFSGYNTGRVFYGITREDQQYFQYKNSAYPCNDERSPPSFCQYKYPNTTVGFGILQLRPSTLEADLKRFLENRTIECIQQFVLQNISHQAILQQQDIKLDLKILDDGIGVDAEYPLQFKVGGSDYFHLSKFDFFYATQFKRLIDSAVAFPLQWDQKFVDFNYSEATLLQPTFTYASESGDQVRSLLADTYKMLSLKMLKTALPTGDDLIEFAAPINTIIRHQPYTFRIARQNRPPALDYVSRLPCPEKGYDYLVIKDHPTLGKVNITLNAKDADEDVPSYGFDYPSTITPIPGTADNNFLLEDWGTVKELSVTARATDGHGAKDEQQVRILVDNSIIPSVKIPLPYSFQDGKSYEETFSDTFYVSKEDPVLVEIVLPEYSAAFEGASAKVKYSYPSQVTPYESILSSYWEETGHPRHFCFSFPGGNGEPLQTDCGAIFDSYQSQILSLNLLDKEPFKDQESKMGTLELEFSAEYCGGQGQSSPPVLKDIVIKDCIPHVNPDHPYPYIKGDPLNLYKIKITAADSEEIDNTANPFLATHSCCDSNFNVKPEDTSCFSAANQPPILKGCFGGSVEAKSKLGYLLEKKIMVAECDGIRGNICANLKPWKHEFLGVCGGKDSNGDGVGGSGDGKCDKVAPKCKNKLPYYYETGQDGFWCYGELGCNKQCSANEEIISKEGLEFDKIKEFPSKFDCFCPQHPPPGIKCLNIKTGNVGECQQLGICS